jgi:hypothetical protein
VARFESASGLFRSVPFSAIQKKRPQRGGSAGTVAGAVCRGRPGTIHDVDLQSASAIKFCFMKPIAIGPGCHRWCGASIILLSQWMSSEADRFRKQAEECRQWAEKAISPLDKEGSGSQRNGSSWRSR